MNDHLIELLAFADACRRASAAHVCAVIPYFGYARSDKRHGSQTHVMRVVGNVPNRPCLIIDDMISTGGTLADAVRTLIDAGARTPIFIAATHGLLLPGSKAKLAGPDVAKVVAFIFIAGGLFSLLTRNDLGGLWIAFIGWFLLEGAQAYHLQAQLSTSLQGVGVADIMARDCTTSEALELMGRENINQLPASPTVTSRAS